MRRHCRRVPALRSSFAGFRFPLEVIVIAVRWYLRYSLSYRDIEELLAERGITVDQVAALSLEHADRVVLAVIDGMAAPVQDTQPPT
jgi:hypothetical protein